LYVTLEPCSNYGKTSPCVNLIIKKKLKKVYFSLKDPDLKSFNKSIKKFKGNGILVNTGILLSRVNYFYRSYHRFKKKLFPFVTCKLAVSRDLYSISIKKRWITNLYSRKRGHLIRSNHDCILTSSKTVIDDNPMLTCRINGLNDQSPARIILDSKLKIPLKSNVIKNASKFKTIIFYNKYKKNKINKLKKLNISLFKISLNIKGGIDLKKALVKTKKLGFSRILLESGITLTTDFLKEKLVDDFKLFISSKNLKKNGKGNIKKYFKSFLKGKMNEIERVNLFGDKLLSYKIK